VERIRIPVEFSNAVQSMIVVLEGFQDINIRGAKMVEITNKMDTADPETKPALDICHSIPQIIVAALSPIVRHGRR
jgi:hypothetical protein